MKALTLARKKIKLEKEVESDSEEDKGEYSGVVVAADEEVTGYGTRSKRKFSV